MLECAIGSLPGILDDDSRAPQASIASLVGQDWFEISIRVLENLTDLQLAVEISGDLAAWSSMPADVQEILPPPAIQTAPPPAFRDQAPISTGICASLACRSGPAGRRPFI